MTPLASAVDVALLDTPTCVATAVDEERDTTGVELVVLRVATAMDDESVATDIEVVVLGVVVLVLVVLAKVVLALVVVSLELCRQP